MGRNMKTLWCLVLCVAAILTLCACSNTDDISGSRDNNKKDPVRTQSTTTSTPASVPTTAPQYEGTEGLWLMEVPDGSGYEVLGIGEATDTDIVIPSEHEGKPVVGIGTRAFADINTITSVVIPGSVKVIGASAFKNCKQIATITLCDGITALGNSCFYGCEQLQSVTIPGSVKVVGVNAFQNCAQISTITLCDGITTLEEGCFDGCNKLQSLEIPETVTIIGNIAFRGCRALTEIYIPGNVATIGDEAFAFCWALTRVEIGEGTVSLGSYVFEDCKAITEVILPSSLESVGKGILYGNSVITKITAPFMGKDAGDNSGLGHFFSAKSANPRDVPSSLKTVYLNGSGALGAQWLSGCSKVETVIIGSGYTSIGEYAFSACSALKNVTFEGTSVTALGRNCFAHCKALESIVIPEGVLSIDTMAFTDCVALKTISLPNSLEEIGHQAFIRCKKLEELIIPENVKLIGSFFVAENNALTSLVFADPTGWVIAESKEGNNSEARDVSDPAANASYFSGGGRNYYVIKMN